MEYQFAIFDMDGTLVDSMPVWNRLCEEYLRSLGVSGPQLAILDETVHLTTPESARVFVQRLGLPKSPEQVAGEIFGMMAEHYRTDISLKPGVLTCLERLRSAGVRMCVASSTAPALIDLCLRRLGLRDYFSFLLSCEELGVGKQSPTVYLEAARRLGCSPEQAIVFEDAIIPATTAKKAGFRLAGVYDAANQSREELEAISDWYLLRWDDESFLAQFH